MNPSLKANPVPSKWFSFEGNRATLRTGKVEIGQGIGIALVQIASDELTIPPERIDLITGDTDLTPDEIWTSASVSVEVGGGAVRAIAATLRERFRTAAALRLGNRMIVLKDGNFGAADSPRTLSYGDLADEVDLEKPLDSAAGWEARTGSGGVAGLSLARPDLPGKLTGGGFIHDIDLAGMLHGRVVLPPRPGASLVAFDSEAVEAMSGVVAVARDGSFIGIAAVREEQAIAAQALAEKLAVWEGPVLPPFGDVNKLLANYHANPEVVLAGPAEKGDICLRFTRPFLAHASIGLVCALAEFREGQLVVWSQSQGVFPLRDAIARTLEMPNNRVRVIHAHGAGCYGHNGADDVALEAALIARATKRPIRLLWTRAQELQAAPAGPAMQVELSAGLDASGRIDRWHHRIKGFTHLARPGWGQGVNLADAWSLEKPLAPSSIADPGQVPFGGAGCRNAPPLYDVPAHVEYALIKERPVRTSALRALGAHINVFAIESMMDELAMRAGRDAVAFRLDHLSDPRARAVIERAAEMADWPPGSSDGSTGKGMGFARYKNTAAYCAVIVQLSLDATVRVERVWAAVDAGKAINPDGVENQIEGGILQSISWTLKEQLRWTGSGYDAPDWDAYPILRFDEAPEINVVLLERAGDAPLGVGECATGPTAAALGNALRNALEIRLTDLPLTPDRITKALI